MKQPCSILCGLIISLSLAACTATGPTATEVPTATEAPTATPRAIVEGEVEGGNQCLDSLTIGLYGAVPQDYELNLVFPAGEVAGVHCVDGQTEERWVYGMPVREEGQNSIFCNGPNAFDSVNFFGTPSSLTVTLTWDDSQIVQHFEPTYEEYWGCDGPCYSGAISVTIPISP